MDAIANNIHYSDDLTDVEKVTLRRVVVRPLPSHVLMDLFSAKMMWDPNHTPSKGLVTSL